MPERGVAAHRGGCEKCPENSLGAFQHAIDLGVHQVEFDVHATRDAVLVVHHDELVTTRDGRRVPIREMSLSEIEQSVELGTCDGAIQRVPTFREVLEIMPTNVWLNIEIKPDDDSWIAAKATQILCRENRLHQGVLGVKNDAQRRAARAFHERVRINNMDRTLFKRCYIDRAVKHCDDFIQLHYLHRQPSPEEVEKLHAAGVRVNYCCVQETAQCRGPRLPRPEVEALFAAGVDFVLADDPEHVLGIAEELGIPRNQPSYEPGPPCEVR